MSFLSGALNMLDSLNPVSKLLDAAGDALGLPPEIKNAIKIGGGIWTGNVVMIATGAANAANDAARHAAATTEYPSNSAGGSAGYGGAGYAAGARQAGTLDPSVLEYRDALRTLSANFETFDTLYGSNNDKFDLATLAKVHGNLSLPADVREAAGFLLANPHYRRQLDTAHRGGGADGTISRKDLDQALRNVDKDIAKHGVRQPETHCPPPSAPPPSCGTPSPGTPSPGTPSPGTPPPSTPAPAPGSGGSPLDPEIHDYLSALKTLEANFSTLDGAAGSVNTRLSLEELRSMAHDLRLSPELRKAAHFLTTNPGYFERLDNAGGADDDLVDLGGVRSERARVEADLKSYGAPSRPGGSSSSGDVRSSGEVGDILRDPSLSLEEKIQLVLAKLMENSDEEIIKTMDDLAAAQDKQAGIQNTPENQKALKDAERNAEQIKLRLQNLIEKRKAMFELMSNMSSKFHEMSKTAISNLGRA